MATPEMPSCNHHSAPKFDGKPKSLAAFIDDVEQLASDCELNVNQKIEWMIRYAPAEEQEFWKLQPAVEIDDWQTIQGPDVPIISWVRRRQKILDWESRSSHR